MTAATVIEEKYHLQNFPCGLHSGCFLVDLNTLFHERFCVASEIELRR
jgi:hypothetical protein